MMFTTSIVPARNLVRATLAGLFDVAEMARYATEVEPIVHRAAAWPRGYLMLLDLSGCAIQPQEVVAAFQQHVARVPRARRCAVVTGGSTIRMQVRRIMQGPSMRLFDGEAEALAWLTGDAAADATPLAAE